MTRLLLVLALIVYTGWFHFSSGSEDENTRITASADKNKAVDQAQNLGRQTKDKAATTIQQARD
jgi:hypothetical protein